MGERVRLQRFLSTAGVAARRKAEQMITAGRITVNGEVVTVLGTKVDPDHDSITVDGEAVAALDHFYVVLNKPKGCITAVTDDRGRPTVMDYLPNCPAPVKPVGRLDFYTEGVLLLTNDGELAAKLLAPASHVAKTYHAKVHGRVTQDDLKILRNGVQLEDGTVTQPADVALLPSESKHSWVAITIHEGKYHQIHRMVEALGFRVDKLQRVAFANLTFHHLRVGDARELTQQELNSLRDAVGLDHSAVARGRWRANREATDIPRRARAKARAEAEDAAALASTTTAPAAPTGDEFAEDDGLGWSPDPDDGGDDGDVTPDTRNAAPSAAPDTRGRSDRGSSGGRGARAPNSGRGDRAPSGGRGDRAPSGGRGNRAPSGGRRDRAPSGGRGARAPGGGRDARGGSGGRDARGAGGRDGGDGRDARGGGGGGRDARGGGGRDAGGGRDTRGTYDSRGAGSRDARGGSGGSGGRDSRGAGPRDARGGGSGGRDSRGAGPRDARGGSGGRDARGAGPRDARGGTGRDSRATGPSGGRDSRGAGPRDAHGGDRAASGRDAGGARSFGPRAGGSRSGGASGGRSYAPRDGAARSGGATYKPRSGGPKSDRGGSPPRGGGAGGQGRTFGKRAGSRKPRR